MCMAFNVIRISLIVLLITVSTLMTGAAISAVFVRGRDLSALSTGLLMLALTWDACKLLLFHAGHKLMHSAISRERTAGKLAIGVAVAMAIASIVCVATSARAALEPTQQERDSTAGEAARKALAELRASELREYDALVASGQLTKARELRAEMRSAEAVISGNAAVMGGNEIVRDSTPIVHADTMQRYGVFVWLGCLAVGALVELATVAVVLVGPAKTTPLPSVAASMPRVTTALPAESVHEELRTGALAPTVSAVRVRLGCGTGKASALLKDAKAKGYLA